MRIKMTIAAAMALVGAVMLAASAFAGSSGTTASSSGVAKKGGTLRVAVCCGDFEYVDPGLSYDTLGWSMLYNTQSLLLNYPAKSGPAGGKLFPDAATAFPKVSKDGKTYVFTIRSGWKFSDGSPISAASFKRAFERNLSPKMKQGSPVGVNVGMDKLIVGGTAFLEGKSQNLTGVVAKGNTLTIRLTKPSPLFLSLVAMQWYGAIKANTEFSEKGLDTYAGSGAYVIKARDIGKSLLLERNPNYKGTVPANPDKILFNVNLTEEAVLLETQKGNQDIARGVPTTAHAGLGEQFGVNKGRYFVAPENCVLYWAMNTTRAPFNNVAARKAVNWAIDRPATVRIAGKFAGKRTTQILVPTIPGYKKFGLYSIRGADIAKAKSVGGNAITGKVEIFHSTASAATQQAQVLAFNLKQAGFDVGFKPTPGSVYFKTLGTKGVDMDLARAGWCADYLDAQNFINVLLDGRTIQDSNNVNFAYLNNASLNRKMDAANALSGDARAAAYSKLDLEIMRDLAPWAPFMVINNRVFVSARTKNVILSQYFSEPVYGAASVG